MKALFDKNDIFEIKDTGSSEIDVEFVVAIPEADIADEAWLISKRGRDNDLLFSQYLTHDCGLIIPENIKAGCIYKCSNLRVVNQYTSNNPESPEVSYDLECDWLLEYGAP
jgi:hypothetical protein